LSKQLEIHNKTFSEVSDERIKAAKQLGSIFEALPDRKQAFEDLLRLCSDEDDVVRVEAVNSLVTVFPNVLDRELVWDKFLNLTAYPEESVMTAAANALVSVFTLMPDKNKAWRDLAGLINSRSSMEDVKRVIISSLYYLIKENPDKQQVWRNLLEMAASEYFYVREKSASLLSFVFTELADEEKEEAWNEVLKLATESADEKVREQAARVPGVAYVQMLEENKGKMGKCNSGELDKPWEKCEFVDKIKPWEKRESEEICKFGENGKFGESGKSGERIKSGIKYKSEIKSKPECEPESELYESKPEIKSRPEIGYESVLERDIFLQKDVVSPLSPSFSGKKEESDNMHVIEKDHKKLASDFSGLKINNMGYIRKKDMADLFTRSGSGLPDKEEVIHRLINLSSDSDFQRRRDSIEALLAAYSRYTDRTQDIWDELLNLTRDEDTGTRKDAANLLSDVFPAIVDKSTAFFDLVKLTESQDSQLRKRAAELLAAAFAYLEDKQAAWDELVRLASVEDREVRKGAVLALSSGYKEIPDKEKGWKDLFRLSNHTDSFVQRGATRALGPAFFHVPDKTQAWRDLQALTDNPYVYVRRYAFRSLGRASLWRALKAENEATYIFGLKEAVNYFKRASEAPIGFHIPEFYHPFYQALLFILFSDRPGIVKLESERYLSKMTDEVMELGENQKLLEIFKQFAGLLRRAGNLSPGDLSGQKKLLQTSILAFDTFLNLLESKEEEVIFAQKTMKKEKNVEKEYSNLGKALLEKVEKKKSSLIKDLKMKKF
jgi:HEAT repeat protein